VWWWWWLVDGGRLSMVVVSWCGVRPYCGCVDGQVCVAFSWSNVPWCDVAWWRCWRCSGGAMLSVCRGVRGVRAAWRWCRRRACAHAFAWGVLVYTCGMCRGGC
ncbi:hypothetical protein KI387_009611, partial [Taxus chinensis]